MGGGDSMGPGPIDNRTLGDGKELREGMVSTRVRAASDDGDFVRLSDLSAGQSPVRHKIASRRRLCLHTSL